MTGTSRTKEDEGAATELVMQKNGDVIVIWAVINGRQIFHAEPHVKMAKTTVTAAVRTWVGRAFNEHLSNDDEPSGGFM